MKAVPAINAASAITMCVSFACSSSHLFSSLKFRKGRMSG
jgi:hypothetical protein